MFVEDLDAEACVYQGEGLSDEFSNQHWQSKTAAVADDYMKLKFQLETAQRDKDRDAVIILSLKHEVGGITGRLAAAVMEHRETRNHWLSEKSELESRTFQMLALQTQIQGTMRKKEKDYEKLQGQLDKVVRDSMRGNKAAIIVSKPLQKNSSQTKITGTLIDAELTAAKSIISLLQHENEELRRAVEGLAISVQVLQKENEENELQRERDYENRGKVKFTDNDNDNFVTAPNTPSICDPLSDERRRKELSEESQSGCSQECSPKDSEIQNDPTSLVHCLNDDLIEGTPSARPVKWMVEQVSTEVKRLRERAEWSQQTPGGKHNYQLSEVSIRKRLADAFLVIQEQDRLIHHALFGRINGLYGSNDSDDNDGNGRKRDSADTEDAGYPASPLPGQSSRIDTMFDDFDSDFMPPASPATMQLLREHNWPMLPRECSPKRVPPEYSHRKVLNDTSALRSKNVPEDSHDALASLLSFSPLLKESRTRNVPQNVPQSIPRTTGSLKKEEEIKNDTRTSDARTDNQCSELDTNFLLNSSASTSATKTTKIQPKRSIPTLKKSTPSKSVKILSKIVVCGTENREQENPKSSSKNISSSQIREITEKEHLKSHKKLFVPKGVEEDATLVARTLDMSEI